MNQENINLICSLVVAVLGCFGSIYVAISTLVKQIKDLHLKKSTLREAKKREKLLLDLARIQKELGIYEKTDQK